MGGPIANHNNAGQPQVLDPGSDEQAFKVLTIYRPYTSVAYLQIDSYTESREKPFLFVSSTAGVITGTCQEE